MDLEQYHVVQISLSLKKKTLLAEKRGKYKCGYFDRFVVNLVLGTPQIIDKIIQNCIEIVQDAVMFITTFYLYRYRYSLP